MSGLVERVVYVDSLGVVALARTLGRPDADGRTLLLVSYGGLARLSILRARQSERREPGTWHRPPQPN